MPAIEPPSQSISPPKSYQYFAPVFEAHSIRCVRIQWVDFNNQRSGITMTKAALGMVVLQLASGFSAIGEYIYVIDLSSFRLCSYAPGHAVFFGFFQEQVPVPRSTGPSFEVPLCPRTVLSRLVHKQSVHINVVGGADTWNSSYATQELGIQFLVGVETEFTLVKSTNPLVPVNDHQWSTTIALSTGTVETNILEEIADSIQADGIELQMYHSEGAPGQYEVVTGPMPPLMAADALVHTRETIYNIASKHGLRATFAPRLAFDSCGSGAHMHVSVQDKQSTASESASELLTSVESAFLAGLMRHLPSVLAFMLPLAASYARMLDGIWSGGTWVCWGVDNREAPVRLTKATVPSSRNFEIRPIDGTSNPYLAVAGILACGLLGVRDQLALTSKNCGDARTAAEMTAQEREAMGITGRLPLNIGEARRCLVADDAVREMLGTELVESFIKVNEMLGKVIDPREGEEEAQAVARLVENY